MILLPNLRVFLKFGERWGTAFSLTICYAIGATISSRALLIINHGDGISVLDIEKKAHVQNKYKLLGMFHDVTGSHLCGWHLGGDSPRWLTGTCNGKLINVNSPSLLHLL